MPTHDNNWMPLYIGDYLRDTTRLTVAQHGAYLLLIMDYWVNGPPPDDDRKLAVIANATPLEWRRKLRPALEVFFKKTDGFWTHKRIDLERDRAHTLYEQKRKAGQASASARRERNGSAKPNRRSNERTNSVRDSVRTQPHCKKEGLSPQELNPVFLTAHEASPPPLPSQGDGVVAAHAEEGFSDALISPEEKAAALAEIHRAIAARKLNGHAGTAE